MNKRALFRLSVAIGAIALVGGAVAESSVVRELQDFRTYMCVNAPDASSQELKQCMSQAGAEKSPPRIHHLSSAMYWGEALGFALTMDVVLACFFLSLACAIRWVGRGFSVDRRRFDTASESARGHKTIFFPGVDSDAVGKAGPLLLRPEPRVPAGAGSGSTFVLSRSSDLRK